ncbi:TIGR01777 family protein [Virgibacillus phasianinus]|uniref:TIGR01777 family protein n=1 Tax=Virgibacillus phasianinus TaxID=2017483 RepID=A0A220TYX2_9BACI|nr:TIGR01777 family oxidoreductase [Virgibacillus phasianinus]ASK61058.1 TIGR01777 family protein [Virgibacillus phasianinus]
MNILITGGTGFVGSHLTEALTKENHHVYILTRYPDNYENTKQITYIAYDYYVRDLPAIHTVINLAGDTLFGYWTTEKKTNIMKSRTEVTQHVIEMMQQMEKKPEVFISASAIGFYGTSEDLIFTENTTEHGEDFLSSVAVAWETTAMQAADEMHIRTVCTRFGIILGEKGALSYMTVPIKMFAGGKIGKGEQWMSWVHIEDVVNSITFCMQNEHIEGPVNVTAPNPKRNKEFTKILTKVLNRPNWFTTPAPLVRTAMGEMSELMTKGQYVLPGKLNEHKYQFSYPYLQNALQEINLHKKPKKMSQSQ